MVLSEFFFPGTTMHAQSMINSLGALTGIAHLQLIKNELEEERHDFIQMLKAKAGFGSHSFTSLWTFKKVIDKITLKPERASKIMTVFNL